MSITFHSTALFVRDIEVSKRFYTEVMEMKIELDFNKNVILNNGLTIWEIWQDHIIPDKMEIDLKDISAKPRAELCYETEDIFAVHKKLCDNNVEFLHELNEEPWGQLTVRFFDPDKHLLEVGESLATFVNRLHKEGRTPEQVSEKTSVPLEAVKQLIQ
ncbi:MAG: glyoxalase [Lentisphaerae bacterium]|nr:glyoxalase [Lentisphaerota bacterium]MCP4101591.1 glyoxalase [Lentisphaerota bacterium]